MKNSSITVIWIVVIIIGISGLFLWSNKDTTATLPAQKQISAGSVLSTENSNYDFGSISMADGEVKTSFTISNTTDRDIKIDSVVTSCMCTSAYILNGDTKMGPYGMPGHGALVPKANEMIGAGEERIIEVVFDPAAHGPAGVGIVDRYVYLTDEEGGVLQLEIKANVNL